MAFLDIFKMLPSRKGIVGINKRNLDLIYTHNKRTYFPNVDNKLLCKKILQEHNIPVPKTLYVVDSPKVLKGWENELSSLDNFVIKPNRGFGGNGIKLIKRVEDTFYSSGEEISKDDITFHLQQIYNGAFSIDNTSDTAYFEETITNHPELSQFTLEGQDGITDIR
ncbi:MAG TPA: alpha-L-glutamate ligase-like protein, partial [candidate division Zixibacteria bacterium]|nr:alpha-L-glutamate ligase-like protein [candidate division Zixibacteria bacterium]